MGRKKWIKGRKSKTAGLRLIYEAETLDHLKGVLVCFCKDWSFDHMTQASPNETTIYYNNHQQRYSEDMRGESSVQVSFLQRGDSSIMIGGKSGVNGADLRGSVNFSSLPEWHETAKK